MSKTKDENSDFMKFWAKLDASMIRQGRNRLGFRVAWEIYRAYVTYSAEDEATIKRFLEHAAYGDKE